MIRYRHNLPQLSGDLFLTDGGLETTLIFHDGIDLPCFAAFDLLKSEAGTQSIQEYIRPYLHLARSKEVGFILESATWRANADWGLKLGYSTERLDAINRQAIAMLFDLRDEFETEKTRIVISGCIGPRGDGYNPAELMTVEEAEQYHATQIKSLRDAGADIISAFTITNIPEAIGITRAAQAAEIPVIISFTLETDGHLPTGQTLQIAIEQVDEATNMGPAYYMINCAHPTHFENILVAEQHWTNRIQGIRANASTKSHAELDESTELDDGNPQELGEQYSELRKKLKNLNIFGACCGTDHRHVTHICRACIS